MNTGLILDNCQTGQGQTVPESSYRKIVAMRAGVVGTLHTGGTRHGREVYDRCEALLDKPLYVLRVGGHRQTTAECLEWLGEAIAQVPDAIIAEQRIVVAVGNEPNLEGWADVPEEYGALYRRARRARDVVASPPLLFACPSVGAVGWREWLNRARAAAGNPRQAIVNLYDFNIGLIDEFAEWFPTLYVGEVNTLRPGRVLWLRDAFATLAQAGVIAATVFIAGGRSDGQWDEGYIISEEEAATLGASPGGTMPSIDEQIKQLLAQNAYLTEALIALREDRWTGPGSVDGYIAALRGGTLPDNYKPTFPKA